MSSVTAVPIRPLKKGAVGKMWIGVAALCLAGAGLAWVGTSSMQMSQTESGLRYRVIQEGEGEPVTSADLVMLHYVGRLENGTEFDSSRTRGQPMVTGTSGIIPGFSEGLQLMRQGGRYRLWIPPEMGYGSSVPPGAPFGPTDTLVFDIEIMEIARGAATASFMGQPGASPHSGGGGMPEGALPEGMLPEGMLPPGAGAPPSGEAPGAGAPPAGAAAPGATAPAGNSQ